MKTQVFVSFPCPTLGSVLFEEQTDEHFTTLCLEGLISGVSLASVCHLSMLRNTFISSLARFTSVHAPGNMRLKHVRAFR